VKFSNRWTLWIIVLVFGSLPLFLSEAQPAAKVPRIGVVFLIGGEGEELEAFRQGLRDLGYIEGKNIVIEYRFAKGNSEQFSDLAADLVHHKVDVILTAGTAQARAIRQLTTTIPIVFAVSGDPVGTGLVASLARPGGNITGLSILSPELSGKRLELLKEVLPQLSRVGVLVDVNMTELGTAFEDYETAARALKIQLQSLEVRSPNFDLL